MAIRLSLLDFSPCNVMAENGRFFPPAERVNTPIGGANYALHVDAQFGGPLSAQLCRSARTRAHRGKVTRVMQRDDGFIRSVMLAMAEKFKVTSLSTARVSRGF